MTTRRELEGRSVLVVEDEYLLAQCLSDLLEEHGAVVLGPAGSVESAFSLLTEGVRPDAALLDVNLGGVAIYPVADRLAELDVPFVFTSGYDRSLIPPRHADAPHCAKPFEPAQLMRSLEALVSNRCSDHRGLASTATP